MGNNLQQAGMHPFAAMGLLAGLMVSACPAHAQAPSGSLATSYSANADKPINIESDLLEVDDKKKIATFKGNVSATQGDFNIRAKELQVTYTAAPKKEPGAKKDPEATPPGNSGLPGGGNADIQQIDAKGKVLVTTKDNQTTTSDWAVFEVKKQLVTIGGDVVVSQGTNTIKGSKLIIDLNTGLSRFETEGRVKGIFTPKAKTKAGADAKPGSNTKAAADAEPAQN